VLRLKARTDWPVLGSQALRTPVMVCIDPESRRPLRDSNDSSVPASGSA